MPVIMPRDPSLSHSPERRSPPTITVAEAAAVLSAVRAAAPGLSWSAAKKLLAARRITVNAILCVDEGRRVVPGDRIEIHERPLPDIPSDASVELIHVDDDIVVVHKPAGMLTLRHPGDVNWTQARKDRQPSLDECVCRLLQRRHHSRADRSDSRRAAGRMGAATDSLLAVQRLDRETSGVLVFARHEAAQTALIRQFARHTAERAYWCVVAGIPAVQTIRSLQVRDRGDGLRGGVAVAGPASGQTTDGTKSQANRERLPLMVTHLALRRTGRGLSELECRLETGRTNQIRIQLCELGHPVCGDVKYRSPFGQPPVHDDSGAPRLMLHAARLGFLHPVNGQSLTFERPWPVPARKWLRSVFGVAEAGGESADARHCELR
jgi:23S rRNA pseudouridine1911/1915/1917 synthase